MNELWEALVGPDIVVDGTVLVKHSVLIRDGRIQGIVPIAQLPAEVSIRDLGPGILTAGLVDIHTHGAAGHGYNGAEIAQNRQALETMLSAGITTVLPTLATAPIDDMTRSLAALETLRNSAGLPRVPGAHLEGPYFSIAQRGAQDPNSLRDPVDGSIDRLLDQADIIRMISFAPELPGAVALTEKLVALGIVAAAGHSDGRESDLLACQNAGLSHVIHVFSGQSTTVRKGPWRHPGMLEATLASEGLTVEMIADGKHLPPALMKIAQRCLTGRLCIVSDSTPGAGLPDGSRYSMGAMDYVVEDGVGMTMDRSSFGGSTTLVTAMLPIAIETLGIGLAEAVAMVTSVPAAAARLQDVGRIAPGFHADFALFNSDLRLRSVALAGQWQDDLRPW
ncbi:hypothetical protein E3O45_07820 [Cryobacterium sp. TMS1-20-1]|uniref:N-acetylglucosamine-6-phosphate deacetylase n=1 Tax=Cryobacterium sp. TMS1-20-1 TaxID=1259223 RepID=UPI001069A845|nr:amidohydrolase family protein [Cryobacterium sp. TMS1-20-1]TFC77259.1 hypothetical protein E3O45_07820 [Cryobacterium sp. TMS1-20-1]